MTAENPIEMVRQQLSKIACGVEFGLLQLFGEEEWRNMGTSGERKAFGRAVKKAVKEGALPEIEWVRIGNSGRYDVYRKC